MIAEPIGLADLATHARSSKFHFARTFKRATGHHQLEKNGGDRALVELWLTEAMGIEPTIRRLILAG